MFPLGFATSLILESYFNDGLLSVGSSNFSDEEEQVVAIHLIVSLKEEVAHEQVCPVGRVVMLLFTNGMAL